MISSDNRSYLIAKLSDWVLWVILAAFIGTGFYVFAIYAPKQKQQEITVSFRDANEISKGSIVRMMGSEIGFVKNVKLKPDRVDVTIETYPEMIEIPAGSTFSILFTGLAGSKTIEIETPNVAHPKRDGKTPYFVEEPIRLKDTLDYQIDIAQALQSGAENFTDFFGKKKPVEELQYNIRTSHRKVANANTIMGTVHDKVKQAEVEFGGGLTQVAASVSNFERVSEKAVIATRAESFGPNVKNVTRFFWMKMLESESALHGFEVENRFHQINQKQLVLSHTLDDLRITTDIDSSRANAGAIANSLSDFNQFMNRAVKWVPGPVLTQIQNIDSAIKKFNVKFGQFMANLNKPRSQRKKEAKEKKKKQIFLLPP